MLVYLPYEILISKIIFYALFYLPRHDMFSFPYKYVVIIIMVGIIKHL